MRTAVLAAALLALAVCSEGISVLVIGSSLSSGVDRPLATLVQAGGRTLTALDSTVGGASFRLHCDDAINVGTTGVNTLQTIRQGGWDYVVLQEQSTTYIALEPPLYEDYGRDYTNRTTNKTEFLTYPAILVAEARAVGAIPVFLMTWSPFNGPETTDIARAYSFVGGLLGVRVAPAGLLFAELFARGVQVLSDAIHPSSTGTYAAACAIYLAMFGALPASQATPVGNTTIEALATSVFANYRSAQLAACTSGACIPFVFPNGTQTTPPPPSVLPPATTTPAVTAPSTTTPRCLSFDASRAINSTVLSAAQAVVLAAQLAPYCVTDWQPCFISSTNVSSFHRTCNNRGPTLSVMRVGSTYAGQKPTPNENVGRVFGGFSPIPFTSVSDFVAASGAFLYRFANNGSSTAGFDVLPIPLGVPAIADFPSLGPSYGLADLLMRSESDIEAQPSFSNASVGYFPNASTWLQGGTSLSLKNFQIGKLEVLFSPSLAFPSPTATTSTLPSTTTLRTTRTLSTGPSTSRIVVVRSSSTTRAAGTTGTARVSTTVNASGTGGNDSGKSESTTTRQKAMLGVALLVLCSVLAFVVIYLVRRRLRRSEAYEPGSLSGSGGMNNPLFREQPSSPGYSSSSVPDEHLGTAPDLHLMDIPLYGFPPADPAVAKAPATPARSGGPVGSPEDEDFVGVVELPVKK